MIATYEIEAWTEGVGRGIASFAVDVSGDALTLADGDYERMVAPRPDSFDPIGTPIG